MSQPAPFSLSKCFSQLTGRKVTFVQAPAAPETKVNQIYGIYTVLPGGTAVVVKADNRLLGSIAGALVGLPDPVVKEHLATTPMDELLRDAIYEVLNVAAAVVATEGRPVFVKMVTDPSYIEGAAAEALKKPAHKSHFSVAVDGYQGGRFSIFAQLALMGTGPA
jgi:hypothetical protein